MGAGLRDARHGVASFSVYPPDGRLVRFSSAKKKKKKKKKKNLAASLQQLNTNKQKKQE
eukprot:NODE_20713_length_785_cov_2.414894.p3 GENE.NODE_20713_length_785_cov_2.414894~~NODE_20713_length_785_cov_2.414894.p3  ORF type:complete len:59 (-),score=22.61 NODE_20713_length_785_cov_2.414894:123-299(-)